MVLLLLLSPQAMMASATAAEPPAGPASEPEGCSAAPGDPLAADADECFDAESPTQDCDPGAPPGSDDVGGQEDGEPGASSEDPPDREPGRKGDAATDDPATAQPDGSDSASGTAGAESCGYPPVPAPPGDEGGEGAEEQAPDGATQEDPQSDDPAGDDRPAEGPPDQSPSDDPAGDDRPAEEAPETPDVEDSGVDESREREFTNCVRTRPYLDCSVDPRSVVDHRSNPDPSNDATDEGDRAAPPSAARRPAGGPFRDSGAPSAVIPEVRSSWQPAGSYNTAALVQVLERDRGPRGDLAPSSFAPFIIAGRASWVDTWAAPRFGPGAVIRQHEGQDVFCDHGAPVLATQEGIVEFDAGGLGGRVARVHRPDGSYWYYAHLSGWNTKDFTSGDAVLSGDVIGFCGNTGNASTTPPHVHFGLYGPDGQAKDPMAWLVRWLRAAEFSAGLRHSGSPLDDPPALELVADGETGDPRTAGSPSPQGAARRADVFGDAARPLTRAGISGPDQANRWPSTSPRKSIQTLEFVGIGLLLATAFLLQTRRWGDRGAGGSDPRRQVLEGGRPGR